jgi:hypothetical protein
MNTIAAEFGGTIPHSLNEYYRGGGLVPNTPQNAAIPTSGTISMGNFYGSANRNAYTITLAAPASNYDVFTNRGPLYVAGTTDITVQVNPGVTIGSTTVPAYAMLVPSSFNPADTITIVNNGVIQGMGGTGGNGAANPTGVPRTGSPGGAGGNAIFVNRPTIITNNGTVASGGGGGGGGGSALTPKNNRLSGGGGGGGAGTSGGAGSPNSPGFSAGSPGTSPAGGAGGGGQPGGPLGFPTQFGGTGGTGGGRGATGSTGGTGPGSPPGLGGAGGAAGNYIVGNPFVTWPVTGTRQGGVA